MDFIETLPLGTVVLLKGGEKKIMIMGLMGKDEENLDVTYDYIGCLYPEGVMPSVGHILFNNEDIQDIIYNGYSNPERDDFLAMLQDAFDSGEK